MRRLALLAVVLLAGCGSASVDPSLVQRGSLGPVELVRELKAGGLVVFLRHTASDRSRDDDPIVDLDDCATQRNLIDKGRAQARTIGEAFRALEIPVGDVRASEYCRTRQTAELAFGEITLDRKLTGFPHSGDPTYGDRVVEMRRLLGHAPASGNTVLVAHVVNIRPAAGIAIAEGELAIFEPHGRGNFNYLGRIPASSWPRLVAELATR